MGLTPTASKEKCCPVDTDSSEILKRNPKEICLHLGEAEHQMTGANVSDKAK